MTSPTSSDLNGVWCADRTDAFAAGDEGTIIRYNGTSWNSMTHLLQLASFSDRIFLVSDWYSRGGLFLRREV
jgi:hypothetical protein